MRTLTPEQQAELTYRLNKFGRTMASSARSVEIEGNRITQEILLRDQKIQWEEKMRQEALEVQKELAQSAKRLADSAEASKRTTKVSTWFSRSTKFISLIIPLIGLLLRKL